MKKEKISHLTDGIFFSNANIYVNECSGKREGERERERTREVKPFVGQRNEVSGREKKMSSCLFLSVVMMFSNARFSWPGREEEEEE